MGTYTIQFCQWIFQNEPQSIKATGKLNDDGVDVEMTAEIKYGDDKVGTIKTSALDNLSNAAKIVGKKGEMTVNTAISHITSTSKQKKVSKNFIFFSNLDSFILVSNDYYRYR